MYLAKQKVRSVLPWQNRANVKSVVPPVFGKTPALMGAATPCPNNGGHPPGPTAPVQPGAPRRLGRRVTDACTCRALSWLSLTAYCFSSSPFSYGGSILYPQKNVKTVIFIGYLKSDVGFFCFRVFEKGDCSKVFCGFFVFSVPWGKAVAVKFYVGFLSKGSLHSKSQASA